MSTLLLLETTEVFEPLMVYWFANDITKLSILHAHAQETYHLPECDRIDHTPIDTTLWTILTRKMPPTPIFPPIKLIASAKLEGLILQAKTTLIVTSFKSML